jgi:hypothetical protein
MKPETAEELHPQSKVEAFTDDVKSYVTTLVELYRLKFTDKLSSAGAAITVYVIMLLLGLLVLIMISIGAAIWISEGLGSSFAGFFIVAGIYVLLGGLIWATKGSILKKPVNNAIIKAMMND